jgi:hypothetical protein
MSPNPRRDTVGGRVFNDLRNLARRQGRSTDELRVGYLLECFLSRVSTTGAREQFIFKGGLLLGVLGARRPTWDIDVLGAGCPGQAELVRRSIEVAQVSGDDDTGLRVIVPARIVQARLQLRPDVSFGDPITPDIQLIDYPQQSQGGFPPYGCRSRPCWRRN